MPLPPTFEARLASATQLSPGVRELAFERTDGAPFAFEAGQWVNLFLPLEGGELRRAYSIASRPNGTPRFELAITRVEGGPGSTYLHAMPVGTVLRAQGPQGFFTRGRGKGPSLFVATGTGVTPMRSMLTDAIASGETMPMWLLFGCRTEEDILYRREFESLAAAHSNVRFVPTLSRGADSWAGRRGYVQTHVRELWDELAASGGAEPHAFICGLQRMVSAVRDLLRKDMNIGRTQVHTERYD